MNEKWIPFSLFACAFLYFNQAYLFPSLEGVGAVFGAMIMGICGLYIIYSFKLKKKSALFWSISLFLTMTLVWYIWPNILIPDYLKNWAFKLTLLTLLPIYPFYYWGRHQLKLENSFIFCFFVNLAVVFLAYLVSKETIGQGRDNVVLNIAYAFVVMMPYLFLLRRHQLIALSSLIYMIVMIFLGAKRGAIVCGGLFTIFYLWSLIFTRAISRSILIKLACVAVVCIASVFLFLYFQDQEFVIKRLTQIGEGNSSGRDTIYATLFNNWWDTSSPINFYLGFGYCSALVYAGSSAHNDWLELLTSCGLVGIMFYSYVFYSFVQPVFCRCYSPMTRFIFLSSFLIWFGQAAISMGYYSGFNFWLVALMSYFLGRDESLAKDINKAFPLESSKKQ